MVVNTSILARSRPFMEVTGGSIPLSFRGGEDAWSGWIPKTRAGPVSPAVTLRRRTGRTRPPSAAFPAGMKILRMRMPRRTFSGPGTPEAPVWRSIPPSSLPDLAEGESIPVKNRGVGRKESSSFPLSRRAKREEGRKSTTLQTEREKAHSSPASMPGFPVPNRDEDCPVCGHFRKNF